MFILFVFIACVCATMIFFPITCVHAIYVCSGDALWQAIYRILIGHLSDTCDWLYIYINYTTMDACCIWIYILIIYTHNIGHCLEDYIELLGD